MRKKVDERIRSLIENGVKTRHRSMFLIIGDKSRDQVVNLHYMLRKTVIKARPTVLWCYKDKLELSSHKKKRAKQVKELKQRRELDCERVDPFLLFLESGFVSHCMYRDSERILGSTYSMCILQDFEALTPNVLARTIETVEGGGLVVLLLRSLSSLTSLCTMVMDVHERFRTKSHRQIVSRFNERFLLSLTTCKTCLVMDDELNILPISSHAKSMLVSSKIQSHESKELSLLKEQLFDVSPVGPLVGMCTSLDQGKAVSTFLDAVLGKTVQNTIALTAPRGRGKSAALGLAVAGAVAAGFSNIFVTAPTPQNVCSLFEFLRKGLHMLKYKEHSHYDVVRSCNPDFRKAIIRINIHKEHRQTIQYIEPHDHLKISQVELLVIDEAAAIPLPIVKRLIGPYLVFLSSTVNGYEGTGRSLSLKLLSHLEKTSQMQPSGANDSQSGKSFQRLELKESIRYASEDPVESWLNDLLCLDATNSVPTISRFPHPSECQLYYVSRDTLFSFHKESEVFLQRIMSLLVSSHYKNSPNDLQLMADAPAHHLFVLLGPVDESQNILPDLFCVIQVCLEGEISRESAFESLRNGHQPAGDQIPWKFCQEFENTDFPMLSGVRIVRIAVHPSALGHGYGSAALDLLTRYYEGQLTDLMTEEDNETKEKLKLPGNVTQAAAKVSLLEETITPKQDLPPLLIHLRDRSPEKIHYIGASFGLTMDLFRFWRKHKFSPFYICDTPNNITGEHSCMILKPLERNEIEGTWTAPQCYLSPFYQCFRERFARSLSLCFREMDYKLAMSVMDPRINFSDKDPVVSLENRSSMISPNDLRLLEAYTSGLKDYGKVRNLVPVLAQLYFQEKLPISLSYLQASILLCMGLQLHDVTYIEGEMKIERQQILSLFRKTMVKFSKYLSTNEFDKSLQKEEEVKKMLPHSISLEDDLDDGARQVVKKMKQDSIKLLDPRSESLEQYSVADKESEFEHTLRNCSTISGSGVLSIKSKRAPLERVEKSKKDGGSKKRKKG